jgi:hypothetical protein
MITSGDIFIGDRIDGNQYNVEYNLGGDNGWIPTNMGGAYAFVTEFTFDASSTSASIEGLVSILGGLESIYINGVNISKYDNYADNLMMFSPIPRDSDDENGRSEFELFEDWNLSINLMSLRDILQDGNNNIAFVVEGISLVGSGMQLEDPYGVGVLGFSGDFSLYASNDNSSTPEPATMLIVGLGLVGLGLRRRFAKKR